MYVTVYLLKIGYQKKKRKTCVHEDESALLLQVTFTLMHPIGLILLVAESKEYIYIYIYMGCISGLLL